MSYGRTLYIEPETMETAKRNVEDAFKKANEAIETGTNEDIKESCHDLIEKLRIQRAFICANYHLH